MLHKIIVENFYSIADRQELTFQVSANAPDLACFKPSPSNPDIRLPTVVGFFGPNASGKSTILRAFISAIAFAYDSFYWKKEIHLYFQPYRQKNWWGKPTKIILEFDASLAEEEPFVLFRYELHLAHEATDFSKKQVAYEALSYAPEGKFRTLFERTYQDIHFGRDFDIPNGNDTRKAAVHLDASVISTLARLNHPASLHLQKIIGAFQGNTIGLEKIEDNAQGWLAAYFNDESLLKKLNKELRRFDIGIESMTIERGPQGLFPKFYHAGLDQFIFLEEESIGTKKFIGIFPRLQFALITGGTALIDEIDSDLHPFLLPELFRWFGDPEKNPRRAQLFFTAHNISLLEELEKEQVFFTEKPSGQSTRVYGARDIKGLRREPSLMKKYLAGELGAIPHVG